MKPYRGRIYDWFFQSIVDYYPTDCMPLQVVGRFVDHPTLRGPVSRTSCIVKAEMDGTTGRVDIETLNSRYTLMPKESDHVVRMGGEDGKAVP